MKERFSAPSLGLDLENLQDCRAYLGSGGLELFKKGMMIGGDFGDHAPFPEGARLEICFEAGCFVGGNPGDFYPGDF